VRTVWLPDPTQFAPAIEHFLPVPRCLEHKAAAWADPLSVRRGSRSRRRGVVWPNVGEERHLSRSFDCDRDLALVPAAGAGHPARANLPSLGGVAAELVDVLVVNVLNMFLAEKARLPLEESLAGACARGRPRLTIALPPFRLSRQEISLRTKWMYISPPKSTPLSAPSLHTRFPSRCDRRGLDRAHEEELMVPPPDIGQSDSALSDSFSRPPARRIASMPPSTPNTPSQIRSTAWLVRLARCNHPCLPSTG
jgi:hypothetical protein